MDAGYQTAAREAEDAFVERRSRFIGAICPVQTEEDALAFVAKRKKAHWDATHHVYAYVLRQGGTAGIPDDGEPQGTAGMRFWMCCLRKSYPTASWLSPDISAVFCWVAAGWCAPILTVPRWRLPPAVCRLCVFAISCASAVAMANMAGSRRSSRNRGACWTIRFLPIRWNWPFICRWSKPNLCRRL